MKVEIDFQSTNRFLMSIGFAICTISIVPAYMLLYGSNSKNTTIFLIISLALVLSIGLLLIYKGYIELKNGCTVTGSVIADTVYLRNKSKVDYTSSMNIFTTKGDPFFKKTSWREVY